MLRVVLDLWRSEQGAVLSTELALIIATMLLAAGSGLGTGLQALTNSVNCKLGEVGDAIESVPVGFSFNGLASCSACVAGSSYCPRESLERTHAPWLIRDGCEFNDPCEDTGCCVESVEHVHTSHARPTP